MMIHVSTSARQHVSLACLIAVFVAYSRRLLLSLSVLIGSTFAESVNDVREVQIAFSPRGEAAPLILRELQSAQQRVDVAMFYFSHAVLADTLCVLARRGVSVRVLTDGRMNRPAHRPLLDRMAACGVSVQFLPLPNDARMHLKCAVIDEATVITGAANWSPAAFDQNFEDTLVIRSRELSRHYRAKLNELAAKAENLLLDSASVDRTPSPKFAAAQQQPPPASAAEARIPPKIAVRDVRQAAVHFCPGREGIRHVLAQVREAAQRIDIGIYLINDTEVVNALTDMARSGRVKVRLLVNSGMLDGTLLPRLQTLWDAGVEVLYFQADRRALHLKSAVIDGRYVWTGTANWTTGAFDLNVEDMLFFESSDMARAYTAALDGIAGVSQSFAPLSLGHRAADVEARADYSRSGWLTGLPPTGPRTNWTSINVFGDPPFPAFETRATVSYLPDEEYFPVLLNLVQSAHQSILITMFAMPETKTAAPYREQLLHALEQAVKRGVYVRMLLHMPTSLQDRLHEAHSNWAEKLRAKGIDVRLNLPHIHLHAKTVVVDLAKILIGSHNWSEGSLSSRAVYESSALIVLPRQDVRFADYLFSRQAISDMRSREHWEQELTLLRHAGGMHSKQRAAFFRDKEAPATP